jgi:hypothetical protein
MGVSLVNALYEYVMAVEEAQRRKQISKVERMKLRHKNKEHKILLSGHKPPQEQPIVRVSKLKKPHHPANSQEKPPQSSSANKREKRLLSTTGKVLKSK